MSGKIDNLLFRFYNAYCTRDQDTEAFDPTEVDIKTCNLKVGNKNHSPAKIMSPVLFNQSINIFD